jgi:hypothetical protein
MHEILHLYMFRLWQVAREATYGQKNQELAFKFSVANNHFNKLNWADEQFNDCLLETMGGDLMYYAFCSDVPGNGPRARQLLRKYPPQDYPWGGATP